MRSVLMIAAMAVLTAGCRSPLVGGSPSAGAVRGQVEGVQVFAPEACVQVCGVDDDGLVTREPFETVPLDPRGRFTTRVLSPGRYRLVYRSAVAPPSITTIRVPVATQAVLRPVVEAGLVELRVAATSHDTVLCRLTSVSLVEGIADVRELRCSSSGPAIVRGMRPGVWRVDLPELGVTTEIDLPVGVPARDLLLDPPAASAGASLAGAVWRLDGDAAAWMVVSARPTSPDSEAAGRWGRYAVTDGKGQYRITGIPPGIAFVRIECREVPIRILPAPHLVPIPPSGALELGFVVRP